MKKYTRILALACACCLLTTVVSCKKDSPTESSGTDDSSSVAEYPVNVTVKLDRTSLSLKEDESAVLNASTESGKSVDWSSDNPSVATVSVVGKVIAKHVGSATITAAIGSSVATCVVTVTAAAENSDYISAEKTSIQLSLESSAQIEAKYMAVAEDGTESVDEGKTIVYESLTPSVATVSENGIITPLETGVAEIRISGGAVETYIVADVYTALISTIDDWNEMLGKSDMFARYYVTNDIDFGATLYNRYHEGTHSGFTGELNGGYHTVKNAKVVGTGTQSLLGGVSLATVKNIAFTNVMFTQPYASGLCDSLVQHKGKLEIENLQVFGGKVFVDGKLIDDAFEFPDMNVIIFPTSFKNVLLDASFVGHGNVGVCKNFYGGIFDGVYVNMRRGDEAAFSDSDYALCQNLYIWSYPNAANNIVIRYSDGSISTVMERLLGSLELPVNNFSVTSSETAANYAAYTYFSNSIWSVSPTGLPVFCKK